MSRTNRGDGNQKPMNENEDSFDMAIESRKAIENADEAQMTVVDSSGRNTGRGESKVVKLSHGDM